MTRYLLLSVLCILLCLLSGCSLIERADSNGHTPENNHEEIRQTNKEAEQQVENLGFTIQVGAFAKLDNAVRLMEKLNSNGLNTYYFLHNSGLFKVRFGNFPVYNLALKRANQLRQTGLIKSYYIIRPEQYSIARQKEDGDTVIRRKIIATAQRFLGIPYRWGGTSTQSGFDCSGLAMVVYRLNGINLPRTSRNQYKKGRVVDRQRLKPADLIFFDTADSSGRVSHVGIYSGDGKFIHASKKGKVIKTASIASAYFKKRFIGARSYL